MNRTVSAIFNIFFIIVTIALFGLVIYLGNLNFVTENFSLPIICVCVIVGAVISAFLATTLHELGHLFFGLVFGMSFNSIRIGFLYFYRNGGKIKCKFSVLTNVAGSCEMTPKNSENIYKKYIALSSGGLVFSAIYLALCILIVAMPNVFGEVWYFLIGCGLPLVAYSVLLNAMPFELSSGKTDGAVILGLLKKDASSQVVVNILTIQGQLYQGKTPSEIDEKLYFDLPQICEDDINFIILTNMRYIYYLDKKEYAKALKCNDRIKDLIEGLPKIYQANLLSDRLFDSCALSFDEKEATHLYALVENYLKNETNCTNYRIRASYKFYVQKAYAEARQLINNGLHEAEINSIKGIGLMETKILNEMKEKLLLSEKAEKEKAEEIKITLPKTKFNY